MQQSKKIGDKGELIAIKYLKNKGYLIKDTNFKFGRFGEIDIVASLENYTTFFEVKYRSSDRYGSGEESITKNKLFKIRKSAEVYCKKNKINLESMKIEAIIIEKLSDKYRLKHYKNLEF